MKIALICRIFLPHIGGIETLTADIASGLVKLGVNVSVLTSRHDVNLSKYEAIDGITVRRFSILTLPFVKRYFVSFDFMAHIVNDVDVVHFISCYPSFFNWYGVHWYNLKKYPIVYTTIWPIPLTYRLYKGLIKRCLGHVYDLKLLKHLLGKADAIITLTSGEANVYRRLLGNRKIVQVIPECVKPPEEISKNIIDNLINKHGIREKEHILITVGRLVPYKRIDLAIYAFHLASKKISNIRFFIVGPIGNIDYYMHLVKIIKNLGLSGKVIFTGEVSFAEREALYAISSAVLHTSTYEAFVRPALEGWRFKKPIIAFNLSPASDFIEEEKGGIVTKKWGDVFEMAGNIVRLLSSGEYLELGKNGFNALMKKYTIDKVAEKYLNVYREVLNARTR